MCLYFLKFKYSNTKLKDSIFRYFDMRLSIWALIFKHKIRFKHNLVSRTRYKHRFKCKLKLI